MNKILKNNLINNGFRNVRFLYYRDSPRFRNIWDGNYWDKPRTGPYLIIGRIMFLVPWFNIDWNPAKEPYDIEVSV
jgi:hypothetical protein